MCGRCTKARKTPRGIGHGRAPSCHALTDTHYPRASAATRDGYIVVCQPYISPRATFKPDLAEYTRTQRDSNEAAAESLFVSSDGPHKES